MRAPHRYTLALVERPGPLWLTQSLADFDALDAAGVAVVVVPVIDLHRVIERLQELHAARGRESIVLAADHAAGLDHPQAIAQRIADALLVSVLWRERAPGGRVNAGRVSA